MFPHGPPGIVGSTKSGAPERTDSSEYQSFYAASESLLKRFADSRKRSRSSESECENKRHKHGNALIGGSSSDDELGSPDNPIDVDRATLGSAENPLLIDAGDETPSEVPDESQSSTEEDSQRTVLSESSDLRQQQSNAAAENGSEY